MAYKDALGEDVEPVAGYEIGRKCAYHFLDYSAFRRQTGDVPKSLWQWLKSVSNADDPIFRWSDPLPAVAHAMKIFRNRVGAR
jgi:hypothetical protein